MYDPCCKKKYLSSENERFLIYCCMMYCFCFGLMLIIAAIAAYSLAFAQDKLENRLAKFFEKFVNGTMSVKTQRMISGSQPLPYLDAEEYCRKNDKFLPQPQSQSAEDQIIDEIKTSRAAKCRYVFFAFVANANVRYQSSYRETVLPSLKVAKDGTLPFRFTKCYVMRSTPDGRARVLSHKKCGAIVVKRLLTLKTFSGYCERHRYRCVDIYDGLANERVPANFIMAKNADYTLSLLPYDKDNHPENLRLRRVAPEGPFVAMATRYFFQYEYGDIQQKYSSKRFTVVDPEYDCLAYDTVRDRMVTRSCESLGCPVCY